MEVISQPFPLWLLLIEIRALTRLRGIKYWRYEVFEWYENAVWTLFIETTLQSSFEIPFD